MEPKKPDKLGLGLLLGIDFMLGGECYNPAAETVENCIFDKIDSSVHP